MMSEYRRNFLMDDQTLQHLEQHVISQIEKRQIKYEQVIDCFYNITRLRQANSQFIEKISQLHKSFYQHLNFSDYVKLINSYIHQEVSLDVIKQALTDLVSKIKNGGFNLKQESFQQRKIFYICLQQIKFQYPSLNLSDNILKEFQEDMQIRNKEEGQTNIQNLTSDESESEDDNSSLIEFSPYEKIICDSLQNLNINFQKEIVIEFFKTDFYLPEYNTIIEFNGDLHFFNGEMTPPTKQKVKYLEHLNYKVIEINAIKEKSIFNLESMTEYLKNILNK